ncbi:hypothetical protein M405DRAFT_828804 [Rhizopogon salebrosus TDB-379]|nr:hypothetical protein M405DRAFT_828804 [Rhizopogon salebrosus TDB-379]
MICRQQPSIPQQPHSRILLLPGFALAVYYRLTIFSLTSSASRTLPEAVREHHRRFTDRLAPWVH